MKNKKILISALGIVVALVLGIAVAYAALSSTLNAKFNGVTQNAVSWDVGLYENWSGTDGSASYCGWATYSKNSITIESFTLSKPGDRCSYEVYVTNKGDIDARISSIIANEPTGVTCSKKSINDGHSKYGYEMICGNLTYSISYSSDMIRKGSGDMGTLSVAYTGTDLSTTPITHTNPGFTLVFGQA